MTLDRRVGLLLVAPIAALGVGFAEGYAMSKGYNLNIPALVLTGAANGFSPVIIGSQDEYREFIRDPGQRLVLGLVIGVNLLTLGMIAGNMYGKM